jgi:hypothetical protein
MPPLWSDAHALAASDDSLRRVAWLLQQISIRSFTFAEARALESEPGNDSNSSTSSVATRALLSWVRQERLGLYTAGVGALLFVASSNQE